MKTINGCGVSFWVDDIGYYMAVKIAHIYDYIKSIEFYAFGGGHLMACELHLS